MDEIKMEKKDFFDRFTALLRNIQEQRGFDNLSKSLIFWLGSTYFDLEDEEDCMNRICDGPNDEGVDAIFIDERDYTINIIQTKIVEDFKNIERNYSENEVKVTLSGFRLITKGSFSGKVNHQLEALCKEYHDLLNTGMYKVKICFFHLNKKPVSLKYVSELKKEFKNVDVEFIDFDNLYAFYVQGYLSQVKSAPEKVSLNIIGDVLKKDKPSASLVITVSAKDIAKLYIDHGDKIFQSNVRYFLGNRNKSINKEIENTSADSEKSKNFWYYNNGITMICRKINLPPNNKLVIIEKMQIINGAQTTRALAEALKEGELKNEAEVLVKIIENVNKDFIEDVTLYTNNQNPIKLRDLCSNDEVQINIQKILHGYGYFYERKRGELNETYPTSQLRKDKLGADWKNKIIDNEKASQAYLSFFLDKPAQAKSEKKRLFMKDDTGFYGKVFNKKEGLLPEKILFSYKLLLLIELEKAKYLESYKKAMKTGNDSAIFDYDFLLHSDFFILNIFKDFLKHKWSEFSRDNLLTIIKLIDKSDKEIIELYNTIKDLLKEYVLELKKGPTYYHNKFFKNEQSIGLIRNYLFEKKKLNFISVS